MPVTGRLENAAADRGVARFRGVREEPGKRRPDYGWPSLTDSERSVAAIIAEGATNREAAAQLFLSRHTIDFHLRQIFRKLEINSRVELTRLVVLHSFASHGHP